MVNAERARELVPELEDHTSLDDYFCSEKLQCHQIIAVFDHDAKVFNQEKCFEMAYCKFLICVAVVFLVPDFIVSFICLSEPSWIMKMSWSLVGHSLGNMLILRKKQLPHTAVTTTGVIHVDTMGKKSLKSHAFCSLWAC
jgi:hypothetical protein